MAIGGTGIASGHACIRLAPVLTRLIATRMDESFLLRRARAGDSSISTTWRHATVGGESLKPRQMGARISSSH